jgi:hypothetical protein
MVATSRLGAQVMHFQLPKPLHGRRAFVGEVGQKTAEIAKGLVELRGIEPLTSAVR